MSQTQYKGKYSHLLEEVEKELNTLKEGKVKDALMLRFTALERLQDAAADLEKEIKQLLRDGKITDLSSLIKVEAGEDMDKEGPIVIKRNYKNPVTKNISLYIDH